MNKAKKIFAVIFAIMAVMLMSTAVFAMSGSGSKFDPFCVDTASELTECFTSKRYLSNVYIKLNKNIDGAVAWYYQTNYQNFHLDLNGKTWSGAIILAINNSSLTIDSEKGGYIKGTKNSLATFEVGSGGKLVINNGIIENMDSYPIYSKGEVIVNGGTIRGNLAAIFHQDGTVKINGGTFTATGDEEPVNCYGEDEVNGGIYNGLNYGFVKLRCNVYNAEIHGFKISDKSQIIGKLYNTTLYAPIDITGEGTYLLKDIAGDNTVTIDGKTADLNSDISILSGASKVVFSPSKEIVSRVELLDDVTPFDGETPVIPNNPDTSLYNYTANWYYPGSTTKVNKFEGDTTYDLVVELTMKNSNYEFSPKTIVTIPSRYYDSALVPEVNASSSKLTATFSMKAFSSYTVSFNKSEVTSGEMGNVTVKYGDIYTLPNCEFVGTNGKIFSNWQIYGSGYVGEIKNAGASITIIGNVTLYPQWKSAPLITVTYDTGSSSAKIESTTLYAGQKINKPQIDDFDGKIIIGWYTDSGYTTEFDFDSILYENTTLYAKLTDINNSLVIEDMNVDGIYTVYYGDKISLTAPALPSGGGQYARSWAVSADGIDTISGNSKILTINEKVIPAEKTATVNLKILMWTAIDYIPYNTYTYYIKVIYKQGDIDGSGEVESEDAAKLLKHVSETENLSADVLKRADMDYNSQVDMRDVILILKKAETA